MVVVFGTSGCLVAQLWGPIVFYVHNLHFPAVQFSGPVLGSLLPLSVPLSFMVFSFAPSGLKYLQFSGSVSFPFIKFCSQESQNNSFSLRCKWSTWTTNQHPMILRNQEEVLFACASVWNVFLTYSHSRPSSKFPFPRRLPKEELLTSSTEFASQFCPSCVTLFIVWLICRPTSLWTSWGQTPYLILLFLGPWHDAMLMLTIWPRSWEWS